MPYKVKESDKVIAYVDGDYKDFDSLEEYINDCDLCERPLEAIERCDEFALQLPKAEDIVDDLIERLYQEDIIPEDWDEIDVKDNLKDLDWFMEEYNKLVDEFNKRQNYNIYRSNGVYIYPEYFEHEIYGNDYLDESFKENEHEICNVIKRINERTLREELKTAFIENEDIIKLTKEQKEKVKQSVKEYFENHPELEVPKNEESGLPFWEDDFMETFSED